MASVNMSIRTDPELKAQAEAIFEELGLTMNGAINMFLKQTVRNREVPLDLSLNTGYPPAVYEALRRAQEERDNGYVGRDAWEVAAEIEKIIAREEARQRQHGKAI